MATDPLESLLREVDAAAGAGPVQDGKLPERIRQLARRRGRRSIAVGGSAAVLLLAAVAVAVACWPGRHDERRIADNDRQDGGTDHSAQQPGVTTSVVDGAEEGPGESSAPVLAAAEEGPDEAQGGPLDGTPEEPPLNSKELIKLLDAAPDPSARRKLDALARTEAGQRLLLRSYLDALLSLDKKGVLNLNVRVGSNKPGADIEYDCWGVMFVDSRKKAYVGIEKVWHHIRGVGGMRGGGSWEKAGGLHTRLQRVQNLLGKIGAKGLRDKRLPRVQFSFVPPQSERFPGSNVPVYASAEGVAYVCLVSPADEASSSDSSSDSSS